MCSGTHCKCQPACHWTPSDGTPPQEMAEELDKHNQLLQTALDDALKVIVELRNDVYQAQIDAQDWQNKYNSVTLYQNMKHTGYVDHLKNRIDELTDQNAQLEIEVESLSGRLDVHRNSRDGWVYAVPDELVSELQDLRTLKARHEVRIENQRKMISVAALALKGKDINGNPIT